MKKFLFFASAFILLCGCQNSPKIRNYDATGYALEEVSETAYDQPEEKTQTTNQEVEKSETDKKKIIKNGSIHITVDNLDDTKSRIDSLVQLHSAYYANESLNNTDYTMTIEMEIRIPSVNFEKFVDEIESGQGEITYLNIEAKDVTEEYIDIETRLENKRNYVKRYNDLLKQARTIKEILEIEEKMRQIEEEIESAEGRLRYLSDQVSYSTLNLLISKNRDYKYKPKNRKNFFERLKGSLSRGWFGLVDFFIFIINLWPLFVIGVAIWFFIRRWNRKRKKKVS